MSTCRLSSLGVDDRVRGEAEQVDSSALEGPGLVQSGQQQHVIDEGPHPGGLRLDPPDQGVEILAVPHESVAPELGVSSDGGQGCAQLVAGVGDETPERCLGLGAGGEGSFDLAEHSVECCRQAPHLGPGAVGGDALGQVAGGNALGGVLDARERTKSEAGDEPGDTAGEHDHEQADQARDPGESSDRGVGVGEGDSENQAFAAGLVADDTEPPTFLPVQ